MNPMVAKLEAGVVAVKGVAAKPAAAGVPDGASFAEMLQSATSTSLTTAADNSPAPTEKPVPVEAVPDDAGAAKDVGTMAAAAPVVSAEKTVGLPGQVHASITPVVVKSAVDAHKSVDKPKAKAEAAALVKKSAPTYSRSEEATVAVAVTPLAVAGKVAAPELVASHVAMANTGHREGGGAEVAAVKVDVIPAAIKDASSPMAANEIVAGDQAVVVEKHAVDAAAQAAPEVQKPANVLHDAGIRMVVASAAPRVEARATSAGVAPASSVGANLLQLQSYEAPTPNRLEIGLRGGPYGWLNVRAEMAGDGNVHALLRGSAEVAPVLHAHAAEMSSYLTEQAVPVTQVSVETLRGAAMPQQGVDAGDAGLGQQGERASQRKAKSPAATRDADMSAIVSAPLGVAAQSGTTLASTGGWLSVRV